jgi:hypothetical protein
MEVVGKETSSKRGVVERRGRGVVAVAGRDRGGREGWGVGEAEEEGPAVATFETLPKLELSRLSNSSVLTAWM